MAKPSWYDRGAADALEGFCDAPYEKGNRHWESYMEGQRDGERELERQREAGDYYFARRPVLSIND